MDARQRRQARMYATLERLRLTMPPADFAGLVARLRAATPQGEGRDVFDLFTSTSTTTEHRVEHRHQH